MISTDEPGESRRQQAKANPSWSFGTCNTTRSSNWSTVGAEEDIDRN